MRMFNEKDMSMFNEEVTLPKEFARRNDALSLLPVMAWLSDIDDQYYAHDLLDDANPALIEFERLNDYGIEAACAFTTAIFQDASEDERDRRGLDKALCVFTTFLVHHLNVRAMVLAEWAREFARTLNDQHRWTASLAKSVKFVAELLEQAEDNGYPLPSPAQPSALLNADAEAPF